MDSDDGNSSDDSLLSTLSAFEHRTLSHPLPSPDPHLIKNLSSRSQQPRKPTPSPARKRSSLQADQDIARSLAERDLLKPSKPKTRLSVGSLVKPTYEERSSSPSSSGPSSSEAVVPVKAQRDKKKVRRLSETGPLPPPPASAPAAAPQPPPPANQPPATRSRPKITITTTRVKVVEKSIASQSRPGSWKEKKRKRLADDAALSAEAAEVLEEERKRKAKAEQAKAKKQPGRPPPIAPVSKVAAGSAGPSRATGEAQGRFRQLPKKSYVDPPSASTSEDEKAPKRRKGFAVPPSPLPSTSAALASTSLAATISPSAPSRTTRSSFVSSSAPPANATTSTSTSTSAAITSLPAPSARVKKRKAQAKNREASLALGRDISQAEEEQKEEEEEQAKASGDGRDGGDEKRRKTRGGRKSYVEPSSSDMDFEQAVEAVKEEEKPKKKARKSGALASLDTVPSTLSSALPPPPPPAKEPPPPPTVDFPTSIVSDALVAVGTQGEMVGGKKGKGKTRAAVAVNQSAIDSAEKERPVEGVSSASHDSQLVDSTVGTETLARGNALVEAPLPVPSASSTPLPVPSTSSAPLPPDAALLAVTALVPSSSATRPVPTTSLGPILPLPSTGTSLHPSSALSSTTAAPTAFNPFPAGASSQPPAAHPLLPVEPTSNSRFNPLAYKPSHPSGDWYKGLRAYNATEEAAGRPKWMAPVRPGSDGGKAVVEGKKKERKEKKVKEMKDGKDPQGIKEKKKASSLSEATQLGREKRAKKIPRRFANGVLAEDDGSDEAFDIDPLYSASNPSANAALPSYKHGGPSHSHSKSLARPSPVSIIPSDPSLSLPPGKKHTGNLTHKPWTPSTHNASIHPSQIPHRSSLAAASTSSTKPKPKAKVPKMPKEAPPRTLHPKMLTRDDWVECAKDLTLTEDGRPPLWAEGRQELCETLEYYKSYQGGHYDLQERCLGYLLDGFPSANDRCVDQGRIIISHGGGCSEAAPLPSSNPMSRSSSSLKSSTGVPLPNFFLPTAVPLRPTYQLKKDQTRANVRVRALLNCLEREVPVVVLAGRLWEAFPRLGELGAEGETEGGTRYAPLGHYYITDVWAEGEPVNAVEDPKKKGKGKAKEEGGAAPAEYHVRFKVRFEWVAAQGKPWFADVIGSSGASSIASPFTSSPDLSAPSAILDKSALSPPTAASPADTVETLSPSIFDSASIASISTEATAAVETETETDKSPASDEGTVTCQYCETTHRRIYVEEIECYNENCRRFFLFPDGTMPSPASLTYSPPLLSPSINLPTSSLIPESLFPRTLQSLSGAPSISDYSLQAWRGFGCAKCGRLNSRADWDRLRCASCGDAVNARGRALKAGELSGGRGCKSKKVSAKGKEKMGDYLPGAAQLASTSSSLPLPTKVSLSPLFKAFSLRHISISHIPGYTGYFVELKSGCVVHHLWPSHVGGFAEADELFEAYQGEEAGKLFVRNTLSTHKSVGGLLCQQFTFNSGARYKHAIDAQTYPFAPTSTAPTSSSSAIASSSADASSSSASTSAQVDPAKPSESKPDHVYAPACAKNARDYLQRVVQLAVGEMNKMEFNEILSVAYMTGGKMNYHDDGERGLGPYVASISLGGDAVMSFRPKVKKASKSKDAAAATEDGQDDKQEEGKRGKATAVLKIELVHGSVMIMEGEDTQKLFEHMVEPSGKLRFAATARWIGPEHLNPALKTTKYASGFQGSASAPSRFAYQDAADAAAGPPMASTATNLNHSTALTAPPVVRRQPVSFFPSVLPPLPLSKPSTASQPVSSIAATSAAQPAGKPSPALPLYRKRIVPAPPPPLPTKYLPPPPSYGPPPVVNGAQRPPTLPPRPPTLPQPYPLPPPMIPPFQPPSYQTPLHFQPFASRWASTAKAAVFGYLFS